MASKEPRARRVTIIRRLREEAGLSQRELGARMKPPVSLSQAQRLEARPENAKVSQLQEIARVLGVPLARLLDDLEGMRLGVGSVGKMHATVPVYELSELGSRGQMQPEKSDRRRIAPSRPLEEDAFAISIEGHANAGVLNDGDVAILVPCDAPRPGMTVLVERVKTGELAIGQFYPLHSTSPDAPGFSVIPHNRKFDPMRCTKRDPGKILGRVVEKRELFN